jgi:hypothetical protein
MQDIYGITEEALREGKPHPYYHNLFIRIEEEMHPVTKLDTRKSHSISGPWSSEWIKDRHLGDVGVVFSHKRKEKVMQQRH